MITQQLLDYKNQRRQLDLRELPAPRYRFLTRSFVEALGLELVPFILPRRGGYICIGNDILPRAGESTYCDGVVFEGHSYQVEKDGLAYRLMHTTSVLSDV